jgi:hypothetical protein
MCSGTYVSSLDRPSSLVPKYSFHSLTMFTLYLSLTKLSLSKWAEYILDNIRLDTDLPFTEKFLHIISRPYTLAYGKKQQQKGHKWCNVFAKLRQKHCIPTTKGLRRPGDAYLSTIKLSDDLPKVSFEQPSTFVSDKFLENIGVRKVCTLFLRGCGTSADQELLCRSTYNCS